MYLFHSSSSCVPSGNVRTKLTGSSLNASKYLSNSSYSPAKVAAFITRNDSIRPAVCTVAYSLALPDVAVVSFLPWKLSVTPDDERALSYSNETIVISCVVSLITCLHWTIAASSCVRTPRTLSVSSLSLSLSFSGLVSTAPALSVLSVALVSILLTASCMSSKVNTSLMPYILLIELTAGRGTNGSCLTIY